MEMISRPRCCVLGLVIPKMAAATPVDDVNICIGILLSVYVELTLKFNYKSA